MTGSIEILLIVANAVVEEFVCVDPWFDDSGVSSMESLSIWTLSDSIASWFEIFSPDLH